VEKTKELNAQGVNGTTVSPAVLNGEAPAAGATPSQSGYVGPTPEQSPAQTTPQSSIAVPMQLAQSEPQQSGPQQQYQDQQQQYQSQQQQYQDQQQQYQDQKQRYDHNIRQYDQARWNYVDYPHAYAYEYGDSPRLMRLYLIAEPSQQLANAPVEGPGGVWVGRVRNVELGVDGRPRRIEISLNRRVSVWASPGDFRFDADNHVLFTDMTRDAFWGLPGATVESGPM
jgi:flagellar motor protein MotB